MKKIMVYQSSSGYTKNYAEWIGAAVGAEVKAFEDVKLKDLQEFDVIVFGAGIYAGRLAKLGALKKWVKKLPEKKFVVWANGSAPVNEEVKERVRATNLKGELAGLPMFYGQSGIDFENMKPLHRFMMNIMVNWILRKDSAEMNEEERAILDVKTNPFDHSDVAYIAPLVAYVEELG